MNIGRRLPAGCAYEGDERDKPVLHVEDAKHLIARIAMLFYPPDAMKPRQPVGASLQAGRQIGLVEATLVGRVLRRARYGVEQAGDQYPREPADHSVRRSRSISSSFQNRAQVWVPWPRVSALAGMRT